MADRDVFVHETSYVDEPASIGAGTRIWHFSHVMKDAAIGRDCVIGANRRVIGDRRRHTWAIGH